jgi:hypothetical protein
MIPSDQKKVQPMDEYKVLMQLLGINKLEVTGSVIVGSAEISLNIEPLIKVGVCPDCGEIRLREHDRGDEQKGARLGDSRKALLVAVSIPAISLWAMSEDIC